MYLEICQLVWDICFCDWGDGLNEGSSGADAGVFDIWVGCCGLGEEEDHYGAAGCLVGLVRCSKD